MDLFSISDASREKALCALSSDPQNNYRVFVNGIRVTGTVEEGASTSSINLKKIIAEILKREQSLLDNILAVQKMDCLDFETWTLPLDATMVHACSSSEILKAYDSQGCCRSKVQGFVLARTAMDCSILISFKKRKEEVEKEEGEEEREEEVEEQHQRVGKFGILRDDDGTFFNYRVMVVDLDLKSITKLSKWIQLDREIVDNYLDVSVGREEAEEM